MLKIENAEIMGWEHAIRGMRNPKNSWMKSDSGVCATHGPAHCADCVYTDCHADDVEMITVYLDITAPLYWWKEFDTYKVGTVANSCSTMHKIAAKEFTLEDFSHEHLDVVSRSCLEGVIHILNLNRDSFNKNAYDDPKIPWWQMIQLLPSSYNQKRTVMLNYEVLANIYKSRRNHKLDEWHTLCDWIERLPYSELITGKEEKADV